MMTSTRISSSFRDPSGFLFVRDGEIFRQINLIYKENYDHLIDSGLYDSLTDAELLIPHQEVDCNYALSDKAYKVIKPELIPFISYPYEWCFNQMKNAALTTLEIQKRALDSGMSVKDSSAYNIQFLRGKPVLMDTLSFEKHREGQPWIAYRQFCQHFLAPLALMSRKDVRLSQLLRVYIDGVPLDLAGSLLPFGTRLRKSLLVHIHLHSKMQKRFAGRTVDVSGRKMGRLALLGLIDSLESAVRKLKWRPKGSEWADYYEDTNYSPDALDHKKQTVSGFLDNVNPSIVWDLGANIGLFSRIAANKGIPTMSFDMDAAAVERNYLECLEKGETNVLPLLLDLTNPSPNIGWQNQERMSILERAPADAVLALALIHHLAISNNVPFNKMADFLHRICNSLIIEFIPKSDSQVQRLLATRDDVFTDYSQPVFEREFGEYFLIQNSVRIRDSSRTLYLMQRKQTGA